MSLFHRGRNLGSETFGHMLLTNLAAGKKQSENFSAFLSVFYLITLVPL